VSALVTASRRSEKSALRHPVCELATAEDVADALLESVEDETGRLQWIVGVDQVERMHMRHETLEAEYIDWSWRTFGPAR
jgi:hypothetical protein